MNKPDAIIIGGGIVGMLTAWQLNERGLQVTVVDKSSIGTESSWAGGGILSPLPPWKYPNTINALTINSAEHYKKICTDLLAQSGVDPQLLQSGMEVIIDNEAEFEEAKSWLDSHAMDHESTAQRQIFLPNIHQIRNPRLLQACLASLKSRGVAFIENSQVQGYQSKADRITGVMLENQLLEADQIIVCAGAWAADLFSLPEVNIQPVLGQMLLFKAQPGMLSHIILHNGKYLIPRKDGHIVSGSSIEFAGYEKHTTEQFRAGQLQASQALLPELDEQMIVAHWCGLRPGSPDGRPWIDRHPEYRNLYIHAGHFRYGLTMAPVTTALLMNLLFDERNQPHIKLDDYSLKAIRQPTVEFS